MPCNRPSADLSPTPGTPGMLSTLSPFNAKKSIISSGPTPNLSSTPGTSIKVLFMVLIKVTWLSTNCAISLSPVLTNERIPNAVARFVNVPMTSSASTFGSTIKGNPIALMMLCNGAICERSSSGIGGRLALYSG